MKSIKILLIWWKKGNNSKMEIQIYFKIAGYVDLDVLIIFNLCQIFDIINGLRVITQNLQFYHMLYFYVKIYLPCNFEVNPTTQFDRLCS
jgi:hypothetical protein